VDNDAFQTMLAEQGERVLVGHMKLDKLFHKYGWN